MNKGTYTALVLCVLISGCASLPQPKHIERSFEFDEPFEDVWESVIHFFSSNSIPIKTIEKDSGIIYAEKEYLLPNNVNDFAECPTEGWELEASDFLGMKMNIFVSTHKDDTTKVTVNLTYQRNYKNIWTDQIDPYECYSTGRMERLVYEEIEKYLK
ncbi:MAG: hypothetical protein OXH84_04435 [Gammaproteobacteria bacterium]|nr:hypothetical protein [Gammaproteobacteria bacterium]